MLLNIRGLGTVSNLTEVEMNTGINFARFGNTTRGTSMFVSADTNTDTSKP